MMKKLLMALTLLLITSAISADDFKLPKFFSAFSISAYNGTLAINNSTLAMAMNMAIGAPAGLQIESNNNGASYLVIDPNLGISMVSASSAITETISYGLSVGARWFSKSGLLFGIETSLFDGRYSITDSSFGSSIVIENTTMLNTPGVTILLGGWGHNTSINTITNKEVPVVLYYDIGVGVRKYSSYTAMTLSFSVGVTAPYKEAKE